MVRTDDNVITWSFVPKWQDVVITSTSTVLLYLAHVVDVNVDEAVQSAWIVFFLFFRRLYLFDIGIVTVCKQPSVGC